MPLYLLLHWFTSVSWRWYPALMLAVDLKMLEQIIYTRHLAAGLSRSSCNFFFLICSLLFIAHREENMLPDYTIGTLQLIINNSSKKNIHYSLACVLMCPAYSTNICCVFVLYVHKTRNSHFVQYRRIYCSCLVLLWIKYGWILTKDACMWKAFKRFFFTTQ